MKKIGYIVSIIISAFLLPSNPVIAQNSIQQEEAKVYNVNVEQFAKLVEANKGIVLDVRTPEEWEE
ncbi:MAG: hypothetical protein KDD29_02275, partial [Flavobacteriales bacterium]|nr:hypothetical protein [Flavobacteriales bacterium]